MVAALRDIEVATVVRGAAARLFMQPSGEIVISGPAGTGKTRAILEWIHERCQTETVRVLVVRKTLESLKASALVTYQDQVLYEFDGKESRYDGVTYFGGNKILPASFTYRETGSKIIVGGLDKPSKILSTEYDIIYVNEATELTIDEWEKLIGRKQRPTLDQHRPPSLLVGDCNPDAPTHWIKQREALGLLKHWPSRHEDNPAMWDAEQGEWTQSGIDYIGNLDTLTGVRKERFRFGRWVAAEGQVYEGWDASVHVIDTFQGKSREEVIAAFPHYWDVDFGFTNPFVWHDWCLSPDGDLILVDEIYRIQRLVEDHAVDITQRTQGRACPIAVITDHDAEDRATFERHARVRTQAAIKDVSPGIQAVQSRLKVQPNGRPRLMLFRDACPPRERDRSLIEAGKPSCTADEFTTYVWDLRPGIRKGEQPVKEHDHGMDSCRYQVMHHEPRRSNRIRGIR